MTVEGREGRMEALLAGGLQLGNGEGQQVRVPNRSVDREGRRYFSL